MGTATLTCDRRWRHAYLVVFLLISVHSVRANEPIRGEKPVWRSIEAELRTIPSTAHGLEPGQVESTGFEEEDGWVPGWFCGPGFDSTACSVWDDPPGSPVRCGPGNPNPQTGWWMTGRAWSCREPHIDTVNPYAGEQHLRFSYDGSGEDDGPGQYGEFNVTAFSPVTGPHPIGPTLISMEIAASAAYGSDLWIGPYSFSDADVVASIRMTWLGHWAVFDSVWQEFADVGVDWVTGGAYRNLTIEVDPCEPALRYYYDGTLMWTDTSGGVPFGQTVDSVFILTNNYGEHFDIDNFSIVRGEPCPHECGNGTIEAFGTIEECESTADATCPGRCVPPGEDGECTCGRVAPTCEQAQELPLETISEITHGGWFTFVADAPSTAIETCGSSGFGADFTVRTGECDDLSFITRSNNCGTNPPDWWDTPADPLASCYGVNRVGEACRCFPTEVGRRYWVELPRGWVAGSEIVITRSNRLSCDVLWDSGACCDGVGGCTDDVAEADCQGGNREWHAQKLCEFSSCRTEAIPTVSEWGLVVLTLLGLAVGTIIFRPHRHSLSSPRRPRRT